MSLLDHKCCLLRFCFDLLLSAAISHESITSDVKALAASFKWAFFWGKILELNVGSSLYSIGARRSWKELKGPVTT